MIPMPDDWTPLWISLKTALAATLLAFFLGIAAARWMMTYRGRGRGLIDGVLTLPLVLPPTVVGFLLLLLLGKNSPVGQVLNQLGISIIFTWAATVIAATVVAFPLMYKTVLGAFEQVDLTLVSSARTLGASEWRIFWQILLPLAWPGVLAGAILAFARALGEFGATLMVGGSIPGVTQTIPVTIFFAAEAGHMGLALAWVLMMGTLSLAIIAGIHYGNNAKPHTKISPNPLMKRGFNWVYFGEFSHRQLWGTTIAWLEQHRRSIWPSSNLGRGVSLNATVPALVGASPAGEPTAVAEMLWQPVNEKISDDYAGCFLPETAPISLVARKATPATLAVKIEKQVPGFHLQTQFETNDQPLGLLGASGSGKSMTLRCIAGLETPTQGQIVLNGRVLFDSETGVNVPSCDRKVGLVFQNYALFPHLTVAQNLAFGMQAIPRGQRMAQVINYLDLIGLSELGDRYPNQLSGGQQQRVALARAIASQPDILLLDEPLSALDAYLRSHIEKLLIEVLSSYGGVTLFITHKLEEAYRVCRNLIVLSDGQVLAEGTKEDIFTRPPTFQVAKVTECKNFSRVHNLGEQSLEAVDWACQLEVTEPIPHGIAYLGIRAHHLKFLSSARQQNTFPAWLAMVSETQHRVSLYLKLQSQPDSHQDYHIQAEVYREKWELLKSRPFPWYVQLSPEHLIMMRN